MVKPRPRRPLRQEFYSLMCVLAIPVALCFVFPTEVFYTTLNDEIDDSAASCAFVTLSEEEFNRALSTARSAWRVSASDIGNSLPDMSLSSLPEECHGAVMSIAERTSDFGGNGISYKPDLLPPTNAAGKPEKIPAITGADEAMTFSKTELLKID